MFVLVGWLSNACVITISANANPPDLRSIEAIAHGLT